MKTSNTSVMILVTCLLLNLLSIIAVHAVEPSLPEHFAIRDMLKKNEGEKAIIQAQALSEKGDAYGHYTAGLLLMGNYGAKANWPAAVVFMEKAADSGCADAAGVLGAVLCDGPKEIYDIAKAVKYLEMAAAKNNRHGFDMLARLYSQGLGVRKDLKKAREHFARAADLGYPPSQKRLGIMMFDGEGGKKDQKNAVLWWNRAAAAGNANAFFLLGHIHETGKYVKKDLVEAAKNYILAAPKNEAAAALNGLKNRLSAAQYEEAQRRAKTWKQSEPWVAAQTSAAAKAPTNIAAASTKNTSSARPVSEKPSVAAELDPENVNSWPQHEPVMSEKQIEQFILKDYCAD